MDNLTAHKSSLLMNLFEKEFTFILYTPSNTPGKYNLIV